MYYTTYYAFMSLRPWAFFRKENGYNDENVDISDMIDPLIKVTTLKLIIDNTVVTCNLLLWQHIYYLDAQPIIQVLTITLLGRLYQFSSFISF